MSEFEYVNQYYGISAHKGARVRYSGNGKEQFGTIKKPIHQYLGVLLDGEKTVQKFHPTWKLEIIKEAEG
jgi:hypothetical protein